jgi:hypothetical protein
VKSSVFSTIRPARRRLYCLPAAFCLLALGVPVTPAQAATAPPAAVAPDYRKGVLYGKVLDAATGKPVADATVALLDKNGKALAWSKTNAQGEYALAADPKTALHLNASRRRGLLEQICRSVGDVVTAPVKIVAGAVANPGKTAGSAAVSVASGTPAPLAAQAAAPLLSSPQQTASDTSKQAGGAAAQVAVGQGAQTRKSSSENGEAVIAVNAPNYKAVQGNADAYWLEAPITEGKNPCGMRAWLSTAKLAPSSGDKPSEITQEALLLTDPRIDPTLASPGATLKISVKLTEPSGTPHTVRVFAREARKDVVTELMPGTGANSNLYSGTLTLDPKTPFGETTVTLAALRSEPVEVKLDKNKPDPLTEFARRLDDMQAGKPYEYDPRIMASANRLDVKVTVLNPKQGTPAPASTPSAPGAAPTGKK